MKPDHRPLVRASDGARRSGRSSSRRSNQHNESSSSTAAAAAVAGALLPTTRRAATNRRHETTIQIRKQRQEDRLRRKRGLLFVALPTTTATTTNVNLETSLQELLLLLSSPTRTLPADADQIRTDSLRIYTSFQMVLAANPQASTAFFQTLLREKEEQSRQLVALLRNHLQQSFIQTKNESSESSESCFLALLNLLLEITSAVKSDKSSSSIGDSENYYGRAPLQWSDLFVPEISDSMEDADHESQQEGTASMMDLLLQMLSTILQHQNPTINVNTIAETICNILGNLVDDGSTTRVLNRLLPYWSSLLMRVWPASLYCCAAMLRHDQTHYGLFFLQHSRNNNHYFLLEQLTDLLLLLPENESSTTKTVEASWMLEGLSRREDEVVHAIMTMRCDSDSRAIGHTPATSSRVMNALVHRLSHAAVSTNPPQDADVLIPALRTIAHVGTACHGYYVTTLLTMPDLVTTVSRLLEASPRINVTTTVEAIRVAGVLLWDAGPPGHLSTDVALPHFMPRLVALLLSQPRMEIRREAVCAMRNAFVIVGDTDDDDDDDIASQNYDALHRMETESHLLAQLRYFVWTSSSSSSSSSSLPNVGVVNHCNNISHDGDDDQSHQESLIRILVDLLRSPSRTEDDTQAVLQLLDPLLRNIEASRYLFQSQGGIDALQDLLLCASSSSRHQQQYYDMESSHRLAERLLDEMLDKDDEDCCCEEEEEEGYDDPMASAVVMENSFAFSSATVPATPLVLSDPSVQQHLPPSGRGRGRTLPAWMVQQSDQL